MKFYEMNDREAKTVARFSNGAELVRAVLMSGSQISRIVEPTGIVDAYLCAPGSPAERQMVEKYCEYSKAKFNGFTVDETKR